MTQDRMQQGAEVANLLSERFAAHFLPLPSPTDADIDRDTDRNRDIHRITDTSAEGPAIGALLALNQWLHSLDSYVFPAPR